MTDIADILNSYDWYDHPDGPKFVETHRDDHRSCGHWLFLPGVFSSFHKVFNNEELWLIHRGRLLLHLLQPDGGHRVLRLGTELAAGERPAMAVPAGCWQAAEIPGDTPYAFGSNVCSPPFSYDQFAIGCREKLVAEFPDHRELVERLTRNS